MGMGTTGVIIETGAALFAIRSSIWADCLFKSDSTRCCLCIFDKLPCLRFGQLGTASDQFRPTSGWENDPGRDNLQIALFFVALAGESSTIIPGR
jgi:hypothetical protein